MQLDHKIREVICIPESDYEMQVAQALGARLEHISQRQMEDYTKHIEEFLTDKAHTCRFVRKKYDRRIYLYKPKPPKGFQWIKVLFSVEEDDDGEYIVLQEFKWG